MTSAPYSARIMAASGPVMKPPTSTTRTPCSRRISVELHVDVLHPGRTFFAIGADALGELVGRLVEQLQADAGDELLLELRRADHATDVRGDALDQRPRRARRSEEAEPG